MSPTAAPARHALVTVGDSLSEHGSWPALVCARTAWDHVPLARSGQTSTEIAVRFGALPVQLRVLPGARQPALEVTPIDPAGDYRAQVRQGMADIEIAGTLDDIGGVLRHRVSSAADEGWTFTPTGGQRLRAPADTHVRFRAHAPRTPPDATYVVWCGRNNPGPNVLRDIRAIVDRLAATDPEARYLVLGVTNAAYEPAGTEGHALIARLAEDLAAEYGARFVDVCRRLVEAHPTVDDTPAASFRSDDVHLNAAGDEIVAEAVLDRIRTLGWSSLDA